MFSILWWMKFNIVFNWFNWETFYMKRLFALTHMSGKGYFHFHLWIHNLFFIWWLCFSFWFIHFPIFLWFSLVFSHSSTNTTTLDDFFQSGCGFIWKTTLTRRLLLRKHRKDGKNLKLKIKANRKMRKMRKILSPKFLL